VEIGRQWRVEVAGDPALALEESEADGPLLGRDRGQAGDGFAVAGDDDVFLLRGLVDEPREPGLGPIDIDGRHADSGDGPGLV
jgi:hypothetical protein